MPKQSMPINKLLLTNDWHNTTTKSVLTIFQVDQKKGLTNKEVEKRRKISGKNTLPEPPRLSGLRMFIGQFLSPLVYILLVAGLVMFFIGNFTDTIVILFAVMVNAVFGFWEERKTSNILEKLQKILKTKAVVTRDGQKQEIFQEELVPGDIVHLSPGSKVPADGRILNVNNLTISEAVLTGEWLASRKNEKNVAKGTSMAERKNMAYGGSLVEGGLGTLVVTATGIKTEAGKIATLVSETVEEESPLRKKLSSFAKTIGIIIGTLCVIIFTGGFLRGGDIFEMFEASVAIAVGGIPEALPIVMTIILAIGMDRLLKKKGLIRKLSSVETLGSTSIICLDKTKTLTKGEMDLAVIKATNKEEVLKISVLCNEAFVENPDKSIKHWRIKGSPTDKALLLAGVKHGIIKSDLEKKSKELAKIPFDSQYKFQLALRREKGATYLYASGAPERLLDMSSNKIGWKAKTKEMAEHGLRVVGVAIKKCPASKITIEESDYKGFKFAGLLGFEDPIRDDIKEVIKKTTKAGLKPIIITGDYSKTAKSIAETVGISVRSEEVMEGIDLDKMNDNELAQIVTKIKIYARSEPKHKIRIVEAWQKKGRIVAMVGDGVNDAPAIKKADIGIALGSGTEVAKESADVVLLDDSFAIILEAIEQGRIILDNLRKSIAYAMSDAFASVVVVGVSQVVFGWPLPVLPVQILWNNIIEDTLPNIAYAFEPGEKNVMERGPNSAKTPLLNKEMKILIFGTGIIDQVLTLLLFWYLWKVAGKDLEYARTMIYGALTMDTAFVVYAFKSLRYNIWNINIFSNNWLLVSSLVVFASFSAAVYLPILQQLLHTVPLVLNDWLILIAFGMVSLAMIEATKWYFIVRHKTED